MVVSLLGTEMTSALATTLPGLELRFAQPGDIGLILRLIRDLAAFERLGHEVVAEEDGLREALFGEPRFAEVVIAEYEGGPAGFALFFHSFSTFLAQPGLYLEDLFVEPQLRGRGIGRALFRCLARLAVERGCGRLEWAVLDWNVDAIRFYERFGARPAGDWTTYRLSGENLARAAHTGHER